MAMSQAQTLESQLERAIVRAHGCGVYIIGMGRRRADGAHLFVVSSARDPVRGHLVIVAGPHLQCDCAAAQYRRLCQHRAIVHERLLAERSASQVAAARTAKTSAVFATHDTGAIASRRDTAILRRSQRPFSIWK
jgi:hypothetical protein